MTKTIILKKGTLKNYAKAILNSYKIVFLFASLTLFSFFVRSQNITPDSLIRKLSLLKEDKNKASAFNSLSEMLQYKNPKLSIAYADSGILLATKLNWDKGIAFGYKCKGNGYLNLKTNTKEAIACFQKSLELSRKISDKEIEAKALASIGNVYKQQSKWFEAYGYYQEAEIIFKKIGDKKSESVLVNNIGTIYQSIGNFEISNEYFQKSYELSIEIGFKRQAVNALNNIGASYKALGELEKALTYYEQCYKLSLQPELNDLTGMTLINIGTIQEEKKQYPEAYKSIKMADSVFKVIPNVEGDLHVLTNLGSYYIKTGDFKKSLRYFKESLKLSDSVGSKSYTTKNLIAIGHAYSWLKNYDLANKYYEEAIDTAKKYFLIQEINDANKLLEESVKAKKDRRENQEYILALLGVFALFLVAIWFSKRKVKPFIIEYLALGSLLLFFELINLFIHPHIAEWTNHSPILMLLIMVLIIGILTPIHHFLIKKVKRKLCHLN